MANANLEDEVRRVVEELQRSDASAALRGNGTRLARAEKQFNELRLLLDVPTVATWCAADLVPSDVPTFVGRPGNVAARGATSRCRTATFCSSLELVWTWRSPVTLPESGPRGPQGCVDIDPSELQKLHPHLQQPIISDCGAFLDELLAQLKALSSLSIANGEPCGAADLEQMRCRRDWKRTSFVARRTMKRRREWLWCSMFAVRRPMVYRADQRRSTWHP